MLLAIAAGPCGRQAPRPGSASTQELVLDLGNKIRMKLLLIPPGEFVMGSPEDEKGRSDDEGPQHEVTITNPFYMGIYEVTQEQYQQIMGTNPSDHKGPRNPVEGVLWCEAIEFCQKLSQKVGKTVRLPAEAEWEYACRAGSRTPFNTGQTIGWHQANVEAPPWGKTKRVGSFKPNGWGLYDMHGNAWEWCADRYGRYADAKVVNPKGASSGNGRVARGGYYGALLQHCRSASRAPTDPNFRLISIGFRVVVDLK
ncbi:MAG: hypothetical protein AMJ81_08075 [Phycisphaerae bacterium SM23_33]|nr:MAG: hypothetical protein AMJ81_08075 [Phycisphaerae bacterium SM23_33]